VRSAELVDTDDVDPFLILDAPADWRSRWSHRPRTWLRDAAALQASASVIVSPTLIPASGLHHSASISHSHRMPFASLSSAAGSLVTSLVSSQLQMRCYVASSNHSPWCSSQIRVDAIRSDIAIAEEEPSRTRVF